MPKKPLQITTSILALIPIITGLLGLTGAGDPIYEGSIQTNSPYLDSNLRSFSGVWLGLGIAILSLIARIEKHTLFFNIVWGEIFLGGIGRLLSMIVYGFPPIPLVALTLFELLGAPFFMYWQSKVANPNRRSTELN